MIPSSHLEYNNEIMEVNIHEAKTHLSRPLERVALGEEVIIAKAGKPVAKLVPLDGQPKRCGSSVPPTANLQCLMISTILRPNRSRICSGNEGTPRYPHFLRGDFG
jgi:prevent-host-death family protein